MSTHLNAVPLPSREYPVDAIQVAFNQRGSLRVHLCDALQRPEYRLGRTIGGGGVAVREDTHARGCDAARAKLHGHACDALVVRLHRRRCLCAVVPTIDHDRGAESIAARLEPMSMHYTHGNVT